MGSGREVGGTVGVNHIMHPTKHTYLHVVVLTQIHTHKPAINLKNSRGRRWLPRSPPGLVNSQLDALDTEPNTPLVVDGRDHTDCPIVPVW